MTIDIRDKGHRPVRTRDSRYSINRESRVSRNSRDVGYYRGEDKVYKEIFQNRGPGTKDEQHVT